MHPTRCGAARRGRWCRRSADARAETPPPLPPERLPAGSRGVMAGSPIRARGRCPFCSRPLARSTVTGERGEFVEAADGATVDLDHRLDGEVEGGRDETCPFSLLGERSGLCFVARISPEFESEQQASEPEASVAAFPGDAVAVDAQARVGEPGAGGETGEGDGETRGCHGDEEVSGLQVVGSLPWKTGGEVISIAGFWIATAWASALPTKGVSTFPPLPKLRSRLPSGL